MNGRQFKHYRKATGLSQADFGELLGLSGRTIRCHESVDGQIPLWLEMACYGLEFTEVIFVVDEEEDLAYNLITQGN